MKNTIAALTLILAGFCTPTYANERPPMDPPSIEKMDTNGDGELQKDELRGPLADDFDKLDLDGSGGLSADEIPEPPAKRR